MAKLKWERFQQQQKLRGSNKPPQRGKPSDYIDHKGRDWSNHNYEIRRTK